MSIWVGAGDDDVSMVTLVESVVVFDSEALLHAKSNAVKTNIKKNDFILNGFSHFSVQKYVIRTTR